MVYSISGTKSMVLMQSCLTEADHDRIEVNNGLARPPLINSDQKTNFIFQGTANQTKKWLP